MKPLLSAVIPARGGRNGTPEPCGSAIDPIGREPKVELPLPEIVIAAEPRWQCASEEKETRKRLKEQYIECLGKAALEITGLRRAIHALGEWGVARPELVQWAVEAGYSTGYVRSLVSRILRDLGQVCRKPGAGRKIPREALALRALAQKHYGDRARTFLLAAYRAQPAGRGMPVQFEPVAEAKRRLVSAGMKSSNVIPHGARVNGGVLIV